MSSHDHAFAAQHGGSDLVVPKRQHALYCGFQGFGAREDSRRDLGEFGVVGGVAGVVQLEGRGRDVEGATPDEHLVLAVLLRCLLFVEALESAVVAFVEAPGADDGHVEGVHFFAEEVIGVAGATEDGGEGEIEGEAGGLERLAGGAGLGDALVGERDVGPAGEAVGLVPGALAVADEDDAVESLHFL